MWVTSWENMPYAIGKQHVQISLRIRTVWSAPLLFAAYVVLHLYLLYPKFQDS